MYRVFIFILQLKFYSQFLTTDNKANDTNGGNFRSYVIFGYLYEDGVLHYYNLRVLNNYLK